MKKKILEIFPKVEQKVVKFTLEKQKMLHFPFFLSKNNKICQKRTTPHWSQHVRLGGVVGGCAFLSLLVMWVSSSIMQSEEPGKISDVQKMRIYWCWSEYIPGQLDPGIWVQD
jgi:hypothetical protein